MRSRGCPGVRRFPPAWQRGDWSWRSFEALPAIMPDGQRWLYFPPTLEHLYFARLDYERHFLRADEAPSSSRRLWTRADRGLAFHSSLRIAPHAGRMSYSWRRTFSTSAAGWPSSTSRGPPHVRSAACLHQVNACIVGAPSARRRGWPWRIERSAGMEYLLEVRVLAHTRRRHRAFYSRRKRGFTSWTSRRPCAGGGMATEELCACCWALGVVSSSRMTAARSETTGHR